MPRKSLGKQASNGKGAGWLHWARFLIAVFALILAAAHLSYTSSSGSFSAPTQHTTTNSTYGTGAPHGGASAGGFNEMGFWFDVEVITYTIIAVVFLLGLRTWYAASAVFNAFNFVLYMLSGFIAIPGLTQNAFGSRLTTLSLSLSNNNILIFAWVAVLILSIVLLKYDKGSGLDKLLVTSKE